MLGGRKYQWTVPLNCPKSNPNFRDKTLNAEENEILYEIFGVVSRFPHYISYYIAEYRLPWRQRKFRFIPLSSLKRQYHVKRV